MKLPWASLLNESTSKTWEIENRIHQEMSSILGSESELKIRCEHLGISEHQKDKVIFQCMLFQARTGECPSDERIFEIKNAVSEISQEIPFLPSKDKLSTLILDREIASALETGTTKSGKVQRAIEKGSFIDYNSLQTDQRGKSQEFTL